jgi:N-acyl-D-amino-acid deacylase
LQFDILIKNGKVIDGAGNPWVRADVGIVNGKIAKLGRLRDANATKILDVNGMIVCPGFIDPHSHSDHPMLWDPRFESTIRQGITTQVVGNCGGSKAPINPERMDVWQRLIELDTPPGQTTKMPTWHYFGEYLDEMDKIPCSTNGIYLIGFSAVRISGGPGYENREPTAEEMESMKAYVDEAMRAGAFGMSTGLVYTPQAYAKTEEVIELAKVIAQHNGLYFSHIRGEGAYVVEAVKECIEIVEKSGCSGGQIAHHKALGQPYWGASKETLRLIAEANDRGTDITADQYPYERNMAGLTTVLPPWAHVGGIEEMLERLRNPEDRERIKKDVIENLEGWTANWIYDVGFERIFIASVKTDQNKLLEGKSIAEITQLRRNSDNWQTLWDLLLEEETAIMCTYESMGEEDIKRIMQGRYTMVGTDGWSVAPTGPMSYGMPHPRFYGTFPRILGKYVRDEKVLTLENAIRKMTSFPAQRLRLWDRGLLREGCWADVVVFDPDTVIDKATYEKPHQFPEGLPHVLVNGEIVVENNQQTDKMPGKTLRFSL